jgi:hypothetical protein
MDIGGQQRQRLCAALAGAFTRGELNALVSFTFNTDLDNVARGETFPLEVLALIRWAERAGRLD